MGTLAAMAGPGNAEVTAESRDLGIGLGRFSPTPEQGSQKASRSGQFAATLRRVFAKHVGPAFDVPEPHEKAVP